MLPLKYHVASPLIRQDLRSILLTSSNFGSTEVDDEHLLKRLNDSIEGFQNGNHLEISANARNIVYPQLDAPRVSGHVPYDIRTYRDSDCQGRGIRERFYPTRATLADLRALGDVGTRLHRPACRGVERTLIDMINRLDEEAVHRKVITVY